MQNDVAVSFPQISFAEFLAAVAFSQDIEATIEANRYEELAMQLIDGVAPDAHTPDEWLRIAALLRDPRTCEAAAALAEARAAEAARITAWRA